MADTRPPRVLIADDEDDLREMLRFRLERQGYEVLTAIDGDEALELIRSEMPELCLLDVMMPKRGGFDVLREVRADPRLAGTRIIMLTARTLEQDVARGFDLGVDDYLTKPFSLQELQARMDHVLR